MPCREWFLEQTDAYRQEVLPPRVNGKVMVGSWVRIRIDYTRSVAGGDDAGR